jgi:hypothetical protein
MTDYAIAQTSKTCAKCGNAFAPGERVASFLLDDVTSVVRTDLHEAEAAQWQPPRLVLCRWSHTVPEKAETPAKVAKSAAAEMEAMLLALAEDPAAQSGSRTVLKYLLALALARRRILREVKDSPGSWLHVKSGEILHAPEPAGMTREDLIDAAMKLSAPAKA